ncbi:NTP transferase domain-containing protein [Neobacillus jeddahensis]|uniref:NTP transferase domain-containing protein n=1 Tax=Neobacillus jeddahensis TaxID=1461580 RepID=UPI0006934A29|nr:NTP transferase domain-containing protein [Neobacillus jeddahensis]
MKDHGIIAVLLAAGKSSRMKTNKLALPLGRTTIGSSTLQNALLSNLAHIIVVTRAEDRLHWIDSTLFEPVLRTRWSTVTCQDADQGQAHSLSCGVLAAIERKPKGIMILLGDQPFLSFQLINDLVEKYEARSLKEGTIPFLAASFQGIPRPPIIFAPEMFPELVALKGDEGARKLIQTQAYPELVVNYENRCDFLDMDTKEEYEQWKGVGSSHD